MRRDMCPDIKDTSRPIAVTEMQGITPTKGRWRQGRTQQISWRAQRKQGTIFLATVGTSRSIIETSAQVRMDITKTEPEDDFMSW